MATKVGILGSAFAVIWMTTESSEDSADADDNSPKAGAKELSSPGKAASPEAAVSEDTGLESAEGSGTSSSEANHRSPLRRKLMKIEPQARGAGHDWAWLSAPWWATSWDRFISPASSGEKHWRSSARISLSRDCGRCTESSSALCASR
ncbi:hypothetical protein [Corynebacterium kroppenstedtii]